MSTLTVLGLVLAGLAAGLHIVFFVLESVLFRRPAGRRLFGVRGENDGPTLRLFAINQGVYNLALAMLVIVGIVVQLAANDRADLALAGLAVTIAGCSVMVIAGIALAVTAPLRLLGAALVQGLPPALAVAALLAGR